jgi:hypothetical protein
MQALLSEGRMDDALAYAEASRGLNQPDTAIDAACERILLDIGRLGEAYEKYALTAKGSSTGLATFRAIVRKYPGRNPKAILSDLALASGSPAAGLPRRKMPVSSISPCNWPTRDRSARA